RFMSEGMAFAIPPERTTVEQEWGGAMGAGHDPRWKQGLHHDTGRSWDLEDVRDFYVGQLFGLDPHLLRYVDAERALDLGRATVAELMARTLSEWRRPGSTCRGGLLVALRDLAPGAGWGVVDAGGRPKAPWFTLKRALAPVAVLVTDEGLNGLHLSVVNDTAHEVAGRLTLALYARGEMLIEEAARTVAVPARGQVTVEAGAMLEGFRDVSYAYRYGPAPYDVVAVALEDGAGVPVSEVVHLPAGLDRATEPDVGLEARAQAGGDGGWSLAVSTRRLAQWVVVEVPGYRAADSWFHLAPGATRTVALVPGAGAGDGPPAGRVRCLNAERAARVVVDR
ncbi:MAG: glycoside hydrolase family 2 protein, partial [Acidimicrobiales bacterium]